MTGKLACRLPGAMAGVPALRRAVSPGTARSESTRAGDPLAMSSTVVTPKPQSRRSVSWSRTWTCESISPGSRTPPAPPMTSAPEGPLQPGHGAPPAPDEALAPRGARPGGPPADPVSLDEDGSGRPQPPAVEHA